MKYSNLTALLLIATCSISAHDSLISRFKKILTYMRSTIAQRNTTSCNTMNSRTARPQFQNKSLYIEYKQAMRELYGETTRTKVPKKPRAPRSTSTGNEPDPILKGLSRRTRERYDLD